MRENKMTSEGNADRMNAEVFKQLTSKGSIPFEWPEGIERDPSRMERRIGELVASHLESHPNDIYKPGDKDDTFRVYICKVPVIMSEENFLELISAVGAGAVFVHVEHTTNESLRTKGLKVNAPLVEKPKKPEDVIQVYVFPGMT